MPALDSYKIPIFLYTQCGHIEKFVTCHEVMGEELLVPGFEEHKFFVHRPVVGYDAQTKEVKLSHILWAVSVAPSGALIGRGDWHSIAEAKSGAIALLNRLDRTKFEKLVAEKTELMATERAVVEEKKKGEENATTNNIPTERNPESGL